MTERHVIQFVPVANVAGFVTVFYSRKNASRVYDALVKKSPGVLSFKDDNGTSFCVDTSNYTFLMGEMEKMIKSVFEHTEAERKIQEALGGQPTGFQSPGISGYDVKD